MNEKASLSAQIFFILLLFFLTIMYFTTGTVRNVPYKIESDGKYYYQYLVSIVEDQDLDFSNNYMENQFDWMVIEIDPWNMRNRISPVTGRPKNDFTIGPAILWLPFYTLAYFCGNVFSNIFNFQLDMNPFGKYFQYAVMYSAVIYAVITLYLLYRLLNRYYSTSASSLSVWLIIFTSPLFYYIVFEPSMSHVYDLFTYTLFLFLFWKCVEKSTVQICALLGGVGALHVLVRTQNIITIFLFSCLLGFYLIKQDNTFQNPSFFLKVFVYSLALSIGILLIPIINIYLYGSPFAIPQGSSFLHPFNPKILQVLFSFQNGMFSHHPLLLIGGMGYIIFIAKSPKNAYRPVLITILLVFILQVYTNSIVSDWWAGHSFGQRRLISSLPLFAFGYGYWIKKISVTTPKLYKRFRFLGLSILTLFNIYLTIIHIFMWDPNQPHNIFTWMFHYAPKIILDAIRS